MKKLRIALWNNLPSGGGKRAFYEIAAGLVGRGHHLESWCPSSADRNYLPLDKLVPEHVVELDGSSFQPRRWQRLAKSALMFQHQFKAMDRACAAGAKLIGVGKFDVLLATNCRLLAVPPIARHVRIPKIIYHQEPNRMLYEAYPTFPWIARPADDNGLWPRSKLKGVIKDCDSIFTKRLQVREEFESVRAFDCILSNSAFSRESMLRSYGLESKVCYLGINTKLFRPTGVAREKYVIGLGGFERHKGIDTAIEAVAQIPAVDRPKLVWVGNMQDSSHLDAMVSLASRLGVQLELQRLVSDEALVDLLNRAAVMIYTSRLEPFGFAPLEANACGTPVVGVAEGGIRETIQHGVNGLIVPDRDHAALGAAILKLLTNPALARSLGETGQRTVRENWTWDACVEKIESEASDLTRGSA